VDNIYTFKSGKKWYLLDINRSMSYCSDAEINLNTNFQPNSQPEESVFSYMRTQLCVTHLCNLTCVYCKLDNEQKYGENVVMGLEQGKKNIDHIIETKPNHVKDIVISLTSNGEPLTNFDMIEALIFYANEKTKSSSLRMWFNFASNATMLDETVIQRILKLKNLRVFFSLDGSPKEQNKLRMYKNGKNTYQDVIRRIKLFHRMSKNAGDPSLSTSTVITTYNLNIADIYEKLINVVGATYIVTRPVRGPHEWDFALHEATLKKYIKAYTKFYHDLKKQVDKKDFRLIRAMAPVYDFFGRPFSMLLLNEVKFHGCPHCPPNTKSLKLYSITYDSNGDIVCPCRDLIGIDDFKVGNLKDGINVGKINGIADLSCDKKETCRTCWARYICGGGCHLQAYYANNDIHKPDQTMCVLTKHVTRLAIMLAHHIQNTNHELYQELIEKSKSMVPWKSKYIKNISPNR